MAPPPPRTAVSVTLLWQVAGEHEIVVLLLLMAGEALGGGIGHRPLRLAAALERLEAPPAGRLEAGAVLLHDAEELAAAFDPGAILVLRLEEVEHEHAAVGERPALHERAHRLGVRVDVVQAAELGEQRVLVGIDDHRLDERPLAVAGRVGNRRLLGRGRGGGAGEGEREAQGYQPVRHGHFSFPGPGAAEGGLSSRVPGVDTRGANRATYPLTGERRWPSTARIPARIQGPSRARRWPPTMRRAWRGAGAAPARTA